VRARPCARHGATSIAIEFVLDDHLSVSPTRAGWVAGSRFACPAMTILGDPPSQRPATFLVFFAPLRLCVRIFLPSFNQHLAPPGARQRSAKRPAYFANQVVISVVFTYGYGANETSQNGPRLAWLGHAQGRRVAALSGRCPRDIVSETLPPHLSGGVALAKARSDCVRRQVVLADRTAREPPQGWRFAPPRGARLRP
jgi:hypothetical protein